MIPSLHRDMLRFGWPAGLRPPLSIGHRGASGHATENTLEAFALAARLGAQMWELDTQLTKDGVCVVSHDDHLLRVFGLDSCISQLTAAELASLPGHQVPTFANVAALARQLGCGLYVEIKAPGSGVAAWRELHAHDQRFAVFGSFQIDMVRELREAGCTYPLSILVPLGHDAHVAAEAAGADIMHPCWERGGERPQDLLTPELFSRASEDRRSVVLWHEERPSIIDDLVRLPVLGICSDRPELIREATERVFA